MLVILWCWSRRDYESFKFCLQLVYLKTVSLVYTTWLKRTLTIHSTQVAKEPFSGNTRICIIKIMFNSPTIENHQKCCCFPPNGIFFFRSLPWHWKWRNSFNNFIYIQFASEGMILFCPLICINNRYIDSTN